MKAYQECYYYTLPAANCGIFLVYCKISTADYLLNMRIRRFHAFTWLSSHLLPRKKETFSWKKIRLIDGKNFRSLALSRQAKSFYYFHIFFINFSLALLVLRMTFSSFWKNIFFHWKLLSIITNLFAGEYSGHILKVLLSFHKNSFFLQNFS